MVDFIGLLAATMAGNRRVPSKVLLRAKHLTVFGLFRIALSKRRGETKKKKVNTYYYISTNLGK